MGCTASTGYISGDDFKNGEVLKKPLGLSIAGVRKFLEDHPEVELENLTTSQINRRIIKPQTDGTDKPFINKYTGLLDTNGKPLVSAATVFVSHAWRYQFAKTVLNGMEEYSSANADTYFWFDLFNNDQNAVTSKDFDWFRSTFQNSIRAIGSVLLVLSPWNDPLPLRRAWCLFEIASSLSHQPDVKLSVLLPSTEVHGLQAAIEDDNDSLIQVLSDIRAEKAEATSDTDRELIFEVIEQSPGGFAHVNEEVKRYLRGWYVDQLRQLVSDQPSNGDLLLGIAVILRDLGFFDEALALNLDCLKLAESKSADGDYLDFVCNNLGNFYRDKNDLENALLYYNKSLELSLKRKGPKSHIVAKSYNNIGGVSFYQGDYDAAIVSFNKALEINLLFYGNNHTEVSAVYTNLGSAYREKGLFDQALECNHKSLDISLKLVGCYHPSVAAIHSNIANVLVEKRQLDEALEYRKKSLEIRKSVLGDSHPFVAGCYNGIANIYQYKGEYKTALEYHNKSLAIRCEGLGPTHPFVADSYSNMGNVYKDSADYDQALEHYNKSVDIRLSNTGEDNSTIALIYNAMGFCYGNKGDLDKALDLQNKALNIRLSLLGENHIAMAESYNSLANIYYAKGDILKAIEYYKKMIPIVNSTYKADHPTVTETYKYLSKLYTEIGQTQEAQECLDKCS